MYGKAYTIGSPLERVDLTLVAYLKSVWKKRKKKAS